MSGEVVEPNVLWVIENKSENNLGVTTWSPHKMFAAEWQANDYIANQPHHMFNWLRVRLYFPQNRYTTSKIAEDGDNAAAENPKEEQE